MIKFLLAAIMLLVVAVPVALGTTERCPEGGVKVESVVDGDLNDVVPVEGTLICVKGSTDATGIIVADGETTLVEYLGNGHDVSHFVTYEEEPTFSPTPTLMPSVMPTPSPSESQQVSPTPTMPAPSVEPSETPTSVPTMPDTTPPSETQPKPSETSNSPVSLPDTSMKGE